MAAISHYMGTFALLSPIWLTGLALLVTRFVTREVVAARIVGALAGAMIGAAITYSISDDESRYGLVLGLIFGGLVTDYVAQPERRTRIITACIWVVLILAGLGVFEDYDYFLRLPHTAFMAGGLAAVYVVLAAVTVHFIKILRLRSK